MISFIQEHGSGNILYIFVMQIMESVFVNFIPQYTVCESIKLLLHKNPAQPKFVEWHETMEEECLA